MASVKSTTPVQRRAVSFRTSAILIAMALSVVLVRGLTAAGSLINESQAAIQPVATAPLPTVPPTQKLTPAGYAKLVMNSLSLHDKIAQMIMVNLYNDGPNLVPDEAVMLGQQHVGSVTLYGVNVGTASQLRALTAALRSKAYLPLLIAIDQEGGSATTGVNRLLNLVGPSPSESQIGQDNSTIEAEANGVQLAQELSSFGINLDLAPVVDLQEANVFNPQLATRLFSGDPATVAKLANAEIEGIQQSGQVMACIKHFPDLGATAVDPHKSLPIVDKSKTQLDAEEFAPYRLLFQMGNVRAVMVTHVSLPQIDPNLPSSLSHAVITGLLRGDLGYQGVVITDDFAGMVAIRPYTVDQATVLAAIAGVDIMMGPFTSDMVQTTIDAMMTAAQNGTLSEQTIDSAVTRILTLKIEMGLIHLPSSSTPLTPTPDMSPTPLITPTPHT